MKLRCKGGELAIIIHDQPGCLGNIGRIVEVRGPVELNKRLGLPCWQIFPSSPAPHWVDFGRGGVPTVIGPTNRIEHPDAWLLPLPKDAVEDEDAASTQAGHPHKRPRTAGAPVPVTSGDYRPRSYFRHADRETELLGRVKGVMRRIGLRQMLELGRVNDLPAELTQAALDPDDREAMGRLHPMFMGGEYLPSVGREEVEIARICIESTTYDVTSLYARRSGRRIHYRVVDEYGGDTLSGPTVRTSLHPLPMGELVKFFLGAWDLCGCLEANFEDDVRGMMGFFRGESGFYPAFDSSLRELVQERFGKDDEELEPDTSL